MREYQICKRCVMDTTDPDIVFDKAGICNHCKDAEEKLTRHPLNLSRKDLESELEKLVQKIKTAGKNKKYDCVIGVSGGVDSTFIAYKTKMLGLRPLAVHLDNGWNSELAVKNIENVLKKMEIDLYTYVLNWEEFKDLQLAFLRASTPDSEIPTDHAIHALLYKIAAQYNVAHILLGYNTNTESIMPTAWSQGYFDWKYIKQLHKRYGSIPLKTFPRLSYLKIFYYQILKRISYIYLLNYLDYVKEDAIEFLEKELNWQTYGAKHHESFYTKLFQSFILPEKFRFDKRKAHLSSMICAKQTTRDDALMELEKTPYSVEGLQRDIDYAVTKFGITREDFDSIMSSPPKSFWDYPSYAKSWHYKIALAFYRFARPKQASS